MNSVQQRQISLLNPEFKVILDLKEIKSKKKNEFISSPTFFVNDKIQKLCLNLYPKGVDSSTNGNMALYLFNDSDYDVSIAYFSLSLIINDNQQTCPLEAKNCTIVSKTGSGWPNFIAECYVLDPANKFIKDDKLTIVFKLAAQMIIDDVNKSQNLRKNNEKLFTNKKHSDVVIKCNGQEFELHKCILANRSSVFEAMFEADMVEKEKNMVEINDVEAEILEQFFKYLYTNQVDNFMVIAKDLLIVADKYLVSDLKDECEESMLFNINMQNAIEYLKIADIYNAYRLKGEVIKFVASNLVNFKNSKEFDSLAKEQFLEIIDCQIRLSK